MEVLIALKAKYGCG